MTSIRSDVQEQINRVVQEAKKELRIEFATMLNKKVVSLEARVEAKANEIRQDTASTLEELKVIVAPVRESQERMWRAIDNMSKEVQELVQGDPSTCGEEETNPLLVLVNLVEKRPVLTTELLIPPLLVPMTIGPTSFTWLAWNSRSR